jgi:hypothetical protein
MRRRLRQVQLDAFGSEARFRQGDLPRSRAQVGDDRPVGQRACGNDLFATPEYQGHIGPRGILLVTDVTHEHRSFTGERIEDESRRLSAGTLPGESLSPIVSAASSRRTDGNGFIFTEEYAMTKSGSRLTACQDAFRPPSRRVRIWECTKDANGRVSVSAVPSSVFCF